MSYKIVVDSCCELPEEYKKDSRFEIIPLALDLDNETFMDDETFDQQTFLQKVKESPNVAKTACPSPDRYMQAYMGDAQDIYVITLSSHLSGSYNSALIGKDIYEEEEEDSPKNIHIIDSWSACAGETNIAMKVMELAESGLPFAEVVEQIEEFKKGQLTYFVLDSLDTLRKNGRLTGLKAVVATTLNIKPVCAGDKGVIVQKSQGVGTKKALMRMADILSKEVKNPEEKCLTITHVNCPERAMVVRDMILTRVSFKSSLIVNAAGVGTTYAGDGGIVVVC